MILGCPDDISLSSVQEVFWTEPTATDNSGVTPRLIQSHFPGTIFPMGITRVLYLFTDMAGNEAQCTFTITGNCVFSDMVFCAWWFWIIYLYRLDDLHGIVC